VLAREHPRDAFVRLHLGLARFWEGDDPGATAAWEQAAKVDPDSQSAVRASDLLHPQFARGLPTFTPSFAITRADADRSDQRGLIARGVLFQRLGRPVSARRAFERAASRPGSNHLDAQVAAAVARFDKADPSAAFSRLGPLSSEHPRSALVRFHLGLLLLWSGRLEPAREQLEQAVAAEPGSRPAREAKRFLDRLEDIE
jgi:tetratricopeptide (TPR) repeat protein